MMQAAGSDALFRLRRSVSAWVDGWWSPGSRGGRGAITEDETRRGRERASRVRIV